MVWPSVDGPYWMEKSLLIELDTVNDDIEASKCGTFEG